MTKIRVLGNFWPPSPPSLGRQTPGIPSPGPQGQRHGPALGEHPPLAPQNIRAFFTKNHFFPSAGWRWGPPGFPRGNRGPPRGLRPPRRWSPVAPLWSLPRLPRPLGAPKWWPLVRFLRGFKVPVGYPLGRGGEFSAQSSPLMASENPFFPGKINKNMQKKSGFLIMKFF